MKASVRSAFVSFTAPLEGVVPFMYLDILGLVTTAIGNLIDPKEHAHACPFVRMDGTPATRQEISEDWERVKGRQDMKLRGGFAFRSVAQLRLTPVGIEQVVFLKLDQMERELKKRFPEFEEWPADAQLATLSMSWACGPHFRFPSLADALQKKDFAAAARHCHINTDGPDGVAGTLDDNRGVIPRNVANKAMYRNAAVVARDSLDYEKLFYATELDPVPANTYDVTTIIGYQRALATLAYYAGKADGVVGPLTQGAIQKFQTDHGLVVDGKVGPKTQTKLLEALQKHKGA